MLFILQRNIPLRGYVAALTILLTLYRPFNHQKMKLFKSISILSIILFLACSGISGEESMDFSLPHKDKVKKKDQDSTRFYYNGSHRIKRGQRSIKRT